MPLIGTEWIEAHAGHGYGASYKYKAEVTVDRDGHFRFTLPVELVSCAQKMSHTDKYRNIFHVVQLRTNWVVSGLEKAKVCVFIKAVIVEYMTSEVKRETIIVYRSDDSVAYWKTDDGEIRPHGEMNGKGKWGGRLHATNPSNFYSVGLAAEVWVRVTVLRESGNEVSYEVLNLWEQLQDDHHHPKTWAGKLNSFVGLTIDRRDLSNMEWMPYTEEAAKFFHDALLAVCKLSDRIESFFGDVNNIHKAIENRTGFLLGEGKHS